MVLLGSFEFQLSNHHQSAAHVHNAPRCGVLSKVTPKSGQQEVDFQFELSMRQVGPTRLLNLTPSSRTEIGVRTLPISRMQQWVIVQTLEAWRVVGSTFSYSSTNV